MSGDKADAQKQARQLHELINTGLSRREANHLLRDGALSAGKFAEARRQGAAKVSARKAAKAARAGRADPEKPTRRSLWGSRKNFREW